MHLIKKNAAAQLILSKLEKLILVTIILLEGCYFPHHFFFFQHPVYFKFPLLPLIQSKNPKLLFIPISPSPCACAIHIKNTFRTNHFGIKKKSKTSVSEIISKFENICILNPEITSGIPNQKSKILIRCRNFYYNFNEI